MLNNIEIKEELDAKNIIIEPFNPRQLGSNSYDVRLGDWIAIGNPSQRLIDPFDKDDIETYWKLKRAPHTITIFPGETILSHTQEVIGGANCIATKMNARSSLGRCGISVCLCAGFGDVGYAARWTMEIQNHLNVAVALKVGMRIAQISFFRVGPTSKTYNGKYGQGKWKPEDMIPKLWKDWDAKQLNEVSD